MGRKNPIAKAPVRRLMKNQGAKIVSADAVDFLLEWIADRCKKVTERSLVFAQHAKRKKVTKKDIKLAISGF